MKDIYTFKFWKHKYGSELLVDIVDYAPHEAKYKRTRAILEQMQGSGCKISISTKSDLILRDLDLIKTFPGARVSWSINTLDELYSRIYSKKDRSYWTDLDQQLREYTAREGMVYVRDDDSKRSRFGELPVVANYFYHEEVKKSAKKL